MFQHVDSRFNDKLIFKENINGNIIMEKLIINYMCEVCGKSHSQQKSHYDLVTLLRSLRKTDGKKVALCPHCKTRTYQKFTFQNFNGQEGGAFMIAPIKRTNNHTKGKLVDATNRKAALGIALEELKNSRKILPICASCKNIRDEYGSWNTIDVYMTQNAGRVFSHGICPDCAAELYPDLDIEYDNKRKNLR